MNLQESIRRILNEKTIDITTIIRRVRPRELEREFEESLDMASESAHKNIWLGALSLDRFINLTISITIDGIHHELYGKLPEDIQWHEDVTKSLKEYYKDRIKVRYNKLIKERYK